MSLHPIGIKLRNSAIGKKREVLYQSLVNAQSVIERRNFPWTL